MLAITPFTGKRLQAECHSRPPPTGAVDPAAPVAAARQPPFSAAPRGRAAPGPDGERTDTGSTGGGKDFPVPPSGDPPLTARGAVAWRDGFRG
jgi:hypothetical protein